MLGATILELAWSAILAASLDGAEMALLRMLLEAEDVDLGLGRGDGSQDLLPPRKLSGEPPRGSAGHQKRNLSHRLDLGAHDIKN